MKKLLLAALVCGFMISSCKKDEKACYTCTVDGSNESELEVCDITEDDAKKMQTEMNAESEGEGTWTCAKSK